MDSIYKYELEVDDEQLLVLPVKAAILTVQVVNNVPYVYAAVNLDTEETEEHHILTFGTGQPIENDLKAHYIGTYQLHEGSLVFHVFEKVR